MGAPHGYTEILAEYGDPAPYILQDGDVSPAWQRDVTSGHVELPEELRLGWDKWDATRGVWLPQYAKRISCNPKVAASLRDVLGELHDAGLWSLLHTYDGCYAWRVMRQGRKLSTHAWAIAVDFNAATNRIGTPGDMDHRIVAAFEDHDWTWGGRWERPDGMHCQLASGY
jgi:hypothetical protein